ncbi:hypothetical protein DITRI_Ditri17bG0124200 [Diplodiscus trichospermus]
MINFRKIVRSDSFLIDYFYVFSLQPQGEPPCMTWDAEEVAGKSFDYNVVGKGTGWLPPGGNPVQKILCAISRTRMLIRVESKVVSTPQLTPYQTAVEFGLREARTEGTKIG